jgi:hypothetical protein
MGTTIPAILQRHGLPDLVAAVYGNGRSEARIRGTDTVVAEAADIKTLAHELKRKYPEGFALDVRYDPHM